MVASPVKDDGADVGEDADEVEDEGETGVPLPAHAAQAALKEKIAKRYLTTNLRRKPARSYQTVMDTTQAYRRLQQFRNVVEVVEIRRFNSVVFRSLNQAGAGA